MDNPTLADIFRTLGSQDAKLDNLKETQDKNHFAVMEEINDIKENCKNQCSSNTYGREAREQRGEARRSARPQRC
jgi:acetyl-CoA carboxylase alpha subunit